MDMTPTTTNVFMAIVAIFVVGGVVWHLLPERAKAFLIAAWPYIKAVFTAIGEATKSTAKRIMRK